MVNQSIINSPSWNDDHEEISIPEEGKETQEVDFMKKNLLILTISFLVSTLIFVGISLVFGATLFGAFQKVTDGWIFGIIFMCCFDAVKKFFEGAKFTKTYIAMMALFFVNVVTFSMASTSTTREVAIGGIIASIVAGVSAIALPFVVRAVEVRRGNHGDGSELTNEDAIQKEWNKLRFKVLKLDKEKQKEVLKAKLAFRLVGDNIFNALDTNRAMVSYNGYSMTVVAGEKANADVATLVEAEEYIDKLLG